MRELKQKDKSKKGDASPLEQTLNSPLEQGGALQELNRAIGNNALSRAISTSNKTNVLQTWSNGSPQSKVTPALSSYINSKRRDGRALEPETLIEMEQAFSADLSNVRIHHNQNSNNFNHSLNSKAFTVGDDIFFSAGSYQPKTPSGRVLLGHELTHVMQQRAGKVTADSLSNNLSINTNADLEREADRGGERLASFYQSNNRAGQSLSEGGKTLAPTSRTTTDVLQPSRVIQKWADLPDTPLISAFFRNNPRFVAVLDDPPQLIQRGQEGPHVSRLQEALIELGYNLPEEGVDGRFGSETEQAVRNFQLEAGAPTDAQDGILGPDTLRELDQRFATVHRSRMTSMAPPGAHTRGNFYVFRVPVTRVMNEQEFLITALTHVLPISDIEAQVLVAEGWRFTDFEALTEANVAAGYRIVRVPITDHESVSGASRRRFTSAQEQRAVEQSQTDLENSLFDLTGTDDIYRLNQQVAAKRQELDRMRMTSIRESGIDPQQKRRNIARLETELAALVRRRDEALERRGITLEIYQQTQQTFKHNFALFAIRIAHRMLRENQASANVEATRYQNLERVREVKVILSELNGLYQQANRERAAGVIHEMEQFDSRVRGYPQVREGIELSFRRNYRWPDGRRGGNEHWENYWDFEQQAFARLQQAAQTYPILAHPGLSIRDNAHRYSAMSIDSLQQVLQQQLTDVTDNISQIRESLNTENIWELEAVIARAKFEMGILDNSLLATIVADGVREASSRTTVRNLLLAALGIGFGLLALASGPIGWAALGASLTVGAVDAYLTFQDISFTRAARRTAVDPQYALTSIDASWFWFALSLVSIGIDAVAAVKIVRGMNTAARATMTPAELQQEAMRVANAAVETTEEAAEGVIRIADRAEVQAAIGSQRAIDTFRIVGAITDPAAAARLANALAENAELLPALLRLENISAEAVQFYAGPGHRFINDLPEVLRLADAGNLSSNSQLYEMLLTDPRMQRVLLDNANNERLLLDDWASWQRARTQANASETSSFVDYLQLNLGRRTSLERSTTLLTDVFGSRFNRLNNVAQNRQVLRQTASNLVDAFNAGTLPRQIQKAMAEVMNRDLIRNASDISSAQERVIRALDEVIGDVEFLEFFARKVGGMSDEVVGAYQHLRRHIHSFDELSDLIRSMRHQDAVLFARTVNQFPNESLAFYRLLATNPARMLAVSELGPSVIQQLARITAHSPERTDELLQAVQRIRSELPAGSRSVEFQRFLERLETGHSALLELERARHAQFGGDTALVAGRGVDARIADAVARGDVEAYIQALRSEVREFPGTYVGRAWDYENFPGNPGRFWRPGDPIDMPSVQGHYPRYDTARRRYWRNRAHYELEARARGEVAHDPSDAIDPMRVMSDEELAAFRDTRTRDVRSPEVPAGAPDRIGRAAREVMELEHHGVPQRVRRWLQLLGYSNSDARQLARVSSPESLTEVSPLEHAFLDEIANRFPSRADASGRRFALSHLGDERVARPLSRMPDSDIRRIVNDIRSEPDFIPEFVPELVDAINREIRERASLHDLVPL